MEKLLVRQKYAEISKQYNDVIADITRIILEKVIQPDIKAKISKLKILNERTEFFSIRLF